MDRTGIIVVSLCAILLVYWFVGQQKYAQQQARFAATNQVAKTESQFAATNSNAVAPTLNATTTALPPVFDTNTPEELLVITNARVRYTFTSRGGGLKSVELLDYPETVSARWKKKVAKDGVATLNQRAPVPVLAILGDASLVGDGNFVLTQTADGVRAEKSFMNGLRISKAFQLSSNYLVKADVRLENASDQPLALPAQEWVVGTATPMDVDDSYFSLYGGAMWSDGAKSAAIRLSSFNPSTTTFIFFARTPMMVYHAGSNNVAWASADNQFFAMLAMPKQPAEQVVALPVTLPAFRNVEQAPGTPPPQGGQTARVYPAQTLSANSNVERQMVFYAGPKEYRPKRSFAESSGTDRPARSAGKDFGAARPAGRPSARPAWQKDDRPTRPPARFAAGSTGEARPGADKRYGAKPPAARPYGNRPATRPAYGTKPATARPRFHGSMPSSRGPPACRSRERRQSPREGVGNAGSPQKDPVRTQKT